MDLSTTLLRERFVIRDLSGSDVAVLRAFPAESVEAMSNRIVIPLFDSGGRLVETLVIRSRLMHSAVRMAGHLISSFRRLGPVGARESSRDFQEAWNLSLSRHDAAYLDSPWICVYKDAKILFSAGGHHPFLDVIEKCALKNPDSYDQAVTIAEETFRKMGRNVSIAHSANIGMVCTVRREAARCGLILRNPHKSTTFNYMATSRSSEFSMSSVQCLMTCAAFLEGIQIAVRLGMNTEKIRLRGLSPSSSPEAKENVSGLARLNEISRELERFDSVYDVHYRPERPDFGKIAREAAAFQRQIFNDQKS